MNNITRPMVWRGLLAIVVGVIAIAWPGITVWALVVLFAVYAFLIAAAVMQPLGDPVGSYGLR